MKIKKIKARRIINSRGDWTIEAIIVSENNFSAKASVPEGASLGQNEAKSLSAPKAQANIDKKITPQLQGEEFESQSKLDQALLRLDATENKSNLGANALLAISLAFSRLQAKKSDLPLWQSLEDRIKPTLPSPNHSRKTPHLLMNVINGGLHAGNNLDFQEYMIVPQADDVKKSLEIGVEIYNKLKDFLADNIGSQGTKIGDEGGFCPNLRGNFEPLSILKEVCKKVETENKVKFSLDIAASNLAKNKNQDTEYNLSETTFTTEGLIKMYEDLTDHFDILSLEDPLEEEDFEGFAQLKEKLASECLLVGDDLTVTNTERIKKASEKEAIDAVIIKPNQIGTLTETLEAIRTARENNLKIIISHRSGETNDSFIADLARAVKAYGLKAGAPARGERVAKYNRLLEIFK